MKNYIICLATLLLLAAARPALAATNVVIQGDSFQSKIDGASPGDTLVVQSGVYSGNLNFTKPLTIVCSGADLIQLSGNTTVPTSGTVIFSQVQFLGTVQVTTNGTVLLSRCNCTSTISLPGNGNLQAFDSQFAGVASGTGGKWVLKRSTFSTDISLSGTTVEALRMTNSATFSDTAPVGSGIRFVAAQSSFNNLSLTGLEVTLGYNFISYQVACTDCHSVLVGNRAENGANDSSDALLVQRGTAFCYNSLFRKINGWWQGGTPAAVQISSAQATLVNCTFYSYAYSSRAWSDYDGWHYSGVYPLAFRASAGGPITIKNCIATCAYDGAGSTTGFSADSGQIAELSYCDIYANTQLSGVSGLNLIYNEPQLNGDSTLGVSSPCRHAGAPDALYNNTDGTRNDIGYTGGPLYLPANYTNNSPMVFWMLSSPQTVLKGFQTNILVNVAASAGH